VSDVTAALLVGALRLLAVVDPAVFLSPKSVKDGLAMCSFSAATMRSRMNLCCIVGTWRS